MKDPYRDMEEKLNKAFENAVPDVLPSALADIERLAAARKAPVRAETAPRAKKSRAAYWLAAAAAVLLLALGTAAGIFGRSAADRRVFATISIDVNPSLEIKINRNERVIEVVPLNEDAKKVTGDMDFSGASLELTVNALIGSMYRHGYLGGEHNAVLVSLDNEDAAKTKDLLMRLSEDISLLLEESGGGKVIAQTFENTERVKETAEKYGIPESKAALLSELFELDPSWEESDCCALMPISLIDRLISCAGSETGEVRFGDYIEEGVELSELIRSMLSVGGIPEYVFIERTEFDGKWWRLTTEASSGGGPDVLLRAVRNEEGLLFISEYADEAEKRLVLFDMWSGGLNLFSEPRDDRERAKTFIGDIPKKDPGTVLPVGPEKAARAALAAAGIEPEECETFCAELIRKAQEGGAPDRYKAVINPDNKERVFYIDALTGEVCGP